MYKAADAKSGSSTAKDAFANIVSPLKDGYGFKDWINADGKVVLDNIKTPIIPNTDYRAYESSKQSISKLTGDLTVTSEFKANTYTIKYSNTFGDSQDQKVYVDENVKLYGEIYLNEGFKLLGWTTSAGSSQVEYKLEGSYTLSGADYEKLVEKNGSAIVNMYPVWEKINGSGSGSGDNTNGGDDSNTDTYLLAGILVVIIILIIVVAVVLRKKN